MLVENGRSGYACPYRLAVLLDQPQFQLSRLRFSAGEPLERSQRHTAIVRVDELVQPPSTELFLAVVEHLTQSRIANDREVFEVEECEAHGRFLEDREQLLFARPFLGLSLLAPAGGSSGLLTTV
jgi:hypothetical protein